MFDATLKYLKIASPASKLELLVISLLGSCIVALSSQISIPLIPVPITLQSLSVLLIASTLGSKCGTIAIVFYLIEGIIGIPVFAGYSCGIKVIFGPTGGYLLGFIPAVYITASLLEKAKHRGVLSVFSIALVGEFALLTVGYLQLAYFFGFSKAYAFGIVPFLLGDLLKVTVFALLARKR
jgi:biotin transport system substrate-specific component